MNSITHGGGEQSCKTAGVGPKLFLKIIKCFYEDSIILELFQLGKSSVNTIFVFFVFHFLIKY